MESKFYISTRSSPVDTDEGTGDQLKGLLEKTTYHQQINSIFFGIAIPDSFQQAYLRFTGDHKIPFVCEPKFWFTLVVLNQNRLVHISIWSFTESSKAAS